MLSKKLAVIPCAVGLGLHRRNGDRLGSPIQLRLLQPHADLAAHRSHRYGALQAPHMVCLLPDGNHDTGYLQAERQRIIRDNRKESFSWLN